MSTGLGLVFAKDLRLAAISANISPPDDEVDDDESSRAIGGGAEDVVGGVSLAIGGGAEDVEGGVVSVSLAIGGGGEDTGGVSLAIGGGGPPALGGSRAIGGGEIALAALDSGPEGGPEGPEGGTIVETGRSFSCDGAGEIACDCRCCCALFATAAAKGSIPPPTAGEPACLLTVFGEFLGLGTACRCSNSGGGFQLVSFVFLL